MKNIIILGFIVFISSTIIADNKTIEKGFTGFWGSTSWIFEFHKTGKYKMTSTGHFTNVEKG